MVTCQAAHADDAPQPLQDIYKIIECGSENLISFCTSRKLNEIVVKVKNRNTYFGGNTFVSNTMLIGNHHTEKLKVCCLTPTVYHLTASCHFVLDCRDTQKIMTANAVPYQSPTSYVRGLS